MFVLPHLKGSIQKGVAKCVQWLVVNPAKLEFLMNVLFAKTVQPGLWMGNVNVLQAMR